MSYTTAAILLMCVLLSPFVIYLSAKLGVIGYLRGRQFFETQARKRDNEQKR